MNDFLLKQFQYSHWATLQLLKTTEELAISDAYIFKMLSHNLNAQFMRLAMINGQSSSFTVWDIHNLNQLKTLNDESFEMAKKYITKATKTDFDNLVEGKTLSGDVFKMAVSDILMHLINHGSHHRGQVATKIRELGYLPPNFGVLQFNIFLKT